MRVEQLFDGIHLGVEPLALCVVSRGWRLRLPRSDDPMLHFVLAGHGRLRVDGGPPQELGPHTLGLVPTRSGHAIEGDGRPLHDVVATPTAPDGSGLVRLVAGHPGPEGLVVACGPIRASYAGGVGIFDLMSEPLVLDFSRSHEMRDTFDRLLDESQRGAAGGRAMIAALMQQCLVLVFRELCEGAECQLPWLRALETPRLRGVLEAVIERPEDPHTLTSLARLAGMSRSAFARDFTLGLGLSPMTFVRQVRAQRAAQLLRGTDLTVTAVAHRVGFSSRSHFSHVFTDAFGQTPSGYRMGQRAGSLEAESLARPSGG